MLSSRIERGGVAGAEDEDIHGVFVSAICNGRVTIAISFGLVPPDLGQEMDAVTIDRQLVRWIFQLFPMGDAAGAILVDRNDIASGGQHPVERPGGGDKILAAFRLQHRVDHRLGGGDFMPIRLRPPGWSAASAPQ